MSNGSSAKALRHRPRGSDEGWLDRQPYPHPGGGTAPRLISIVSAAEIMVGSQTLSSCGADLRPRLLVRGTSCAGACAEPRLSWHSGRSPDHGIGRRSRKIRRGMIRLIEPHPWPERRNPPGESLATCGWWRSHGPSSSGSMIAPRRRTSWSCLGLCVCER